MKITNDTSKVPVNAKTTAGKERMSNSTRGTSRERQTKTVKNTE